MQHFNNKKHILLRQMLNLVLMDFYFIDVPIIFIYHLLMNLVTIKIKL